MKYLTLLVLVLLFENSAFGDGLIIGCDHYDVHYTPLDVKLFIPITEVDIENRSRCQFEVASCEFDLLFSKKETSKKKIVGGLRVKIKNKSSGEILYITSFREVIRKIDNDFQLLEKTKEFDLVKVIGSFAKRNCKR